MGLYDTISVWPKGEVVCAAGHPLDELQTKDLDCSLTHYVVFDRSLFSAGRAGVPSIVQEEGHLVLRRSTRLVAESATATVHVYGHCPACRPVLHVRPTGAWGDQVHEREPWAEWELSFVDGRLIRIAPVRLESRDDVRTALRAEGVEVLDDDERLARMHFARRDASRDASRLG